LRQDALGLFAYPVGRAQFRLLSHGHPNVAKHRTIPRTRPSTRRKIVISRVAVAMATLA
jgi:hypothetical protein